jgi:hypothetical protein
LTGSLPESPIKSSSVRSYTGVRFGVYVTPLAVAGRSPYGMK